MLIRLPLIVAAFVAAVLTFGSPLRAQQLADRSEIASQPAVDPVEVARVYIGTYTGGASQGIYVCELDISTGQLSAPRLAAEARNPSFLALHPTGRRLFAVSEIDDHNGQKTGGVIALAVDEQTGALERLNEQPSQGAGPCHVSVDAAGRNVLVANYGGGSAAVFPIDPEGRLGPASAAIQHTGSSVNPSRQQAPHAHSINLDPSNRFAYVADLGLDKVMIYRFNGEYGELEINSPPFAEVAPGAGPRHFAFHPNGRRAYVINELSSTITVFAFDPNTGGLAELQTIGTLPEEWEGNNSTAEVQVHPSGKFVYGSNRGHDSIAIFRVKGESGRLAPAGHAATGGRTPRNFGIDPSGRWLLAANQNSDSIVVFEIDPVTGSLQPTGQAVEVGSPVCVKMQMLRR